MKKDVIKLFWGNRKGFFFFLFLFCAEVSLLDIHQTHKYKYKRYQRELRDVELDSSFLS